MYHMIWSISYTVYDLKLLIRSIDLKKLVVLEARVIVSFLRQVHPVSVQAKVEVGIIGHHVTVLIAVENRDEKCHDSEPARPRYG